MKKILSLMLVTVMVFGVMPFIVSAEDEIKPIELLDAKYAESVADLNNLGIMQGYPDGSFGVDNQITRAEMAKIMVASMGLAKTGETPIDTEFIDVTKEHWAAGYIALAQNLGVINGNGDGTFTPDNSVTYSEVIKMIVCVLGYEPKVQSMGMGYPTGYAKAAADLKIIEGIDFVLENSALRGEVAIMIHTALDTPIMEQRITNDSIEYTIMDGKNGIALKTLRTEKFNAPKSEEVTEAEVEKAFEENYLKSKTISLVTMADGTQTPPNSETLEDYRIVSVTRENLPQYPNVWSVVYDVKPKHNPDADIDPSKSPYMYGWVAGNGVIDGDWVRGKSLFVEVTKTDGIVKLDVIGTGL